MLVSVIHLPALPGTAAATHSLDAIRRRAVAEARQLHEAGFSALIVENFGDAPFRKSVEPHTIAAMTRCVADIVELQVVKVGVNVLRNDGAAALGIAAQSGAQFVRVNVLSGVYATDQGIIEGQAPELLDYRRRLGADIEIFADVHVKHAQPLSQPDIAMAAEETAYRAGADALVVSGVGTGHATDVDEIKRVKAAVPDRAVLVGSGVTAATLERYIEVADGVIVGSCLRAAGRPGAEIDPSRLETFAAAIASL